MAKTPYKLWVGKKPIIKHLHVWDCLAEAMPYKPNEKKLDLRTISCYFVGYSERYRGFKFYDTTTKSFFEMGNTRFHEEVEFKGEDKVRDIVFEGEFISLPTVAIDDDQELITNNVQKENPKQDIVDPLSIQEVQTKLPQEPMPLKRSTREKRSAISDDYIVFLQEHQVNIDIMDDDPINIHQAINSSNSQKWIDSMNDEFKSMKDNDVWDLVPLPEGMKPIGCK